MRLLILRWQMCTPPGHFLQNSTATCLRPKTAA